jgi:uncharacterized membrane protein/uncharacterized membrane protein YphA (DoxX/SURF4 family)
MPKVPRRVPEGRRLRFPSQRRPVPLECIAPSLARPGGNGLPLALTGTVDHPAPRRSPIVLTGSLVHASATLLLVAIPSQVAWPYFVGGLVLAIGLAAIFLRGEWANARGLEKLILFGPAFYAAPIAAFGAEHFTEAKGIATLVPAWIPWHLFWVYFLGVCFIAAGFSLVTRIQARLAALLLSLTFVLFVALMDAPAWIHGPRDRFITALMLREISFSGGPLALAASLFPASRERAARTLAGIARFLVGIPILYYALEQFLHGDHVPGIPLELVTPTWIWGHAFWTYFTAAVYAVAGPLLLIGWKPRLCAACLGLAVLLGILGIYLPMGIVERASLDLGLNYPADTLFFCGTVLLLARAMPREASAAPLAASAPVPVAVAE